MWRRKLIDTFLRLKLDAKAEGRRKVRGETPFVRECHKALRNLPWSSDLSRSRKELSKELVVCFGSDLLVNRLGWSIDEFHLHWAPSSGFLNNSEFSLIWCLSWNGLPVLSLNYKASLADMPDCTHCSWEEMAEYAFYYCERICPFWNQVREWTVCIEPSSSCCSTLVTSLVMFYLRIKVSSVWYFSRS